MSFFRIDFGTGYIGNSELWINLDNIRFIDVQSECIASGSEYSDKAKNWKHQVIIDYSDNKTKSFNLNSRGIDDLSQIILGEPFFAEEEDRKEHGLKPLYKDGK